VDDARYCSFLKGMTEEEAKKLGVDKDQRSFYVRWNANKQNYAVSEPDRWFVRADGGVLLPAEFARSTVPESSPGNRRKEPSQNLNGREKRKKQASLEMEADNVWV
jgi:hypothetical protein